MIAATVERVAISRIVVGVRRRQKLGNLKRLANSIEVLGLFHPILIRNGHELVAGQRRLEACKLLGWTTIPARDVTGCDDEALRAIELEENTERDDLNDYEKSKAQLAAIRQTEATLKAKAAEKSANNGASRTDNRRRHDVPTGNPKGRPKGTAKPTSKRSVAEQTGTSRHERQRKERHVELAEQFPFMKRQGWVLHNVIEAGEILERQFPESEHPALATLLDRGDLPPRKTIAILENLAKKTTGERREIYAAATDPDPHVRSDALAKAAAQPPMPDPAMSALADARAALIKAEHVCRVPGFAAEIEPARIIVHDLLQKLLKTTGGHPI